MNSKYHKEHYKKAEELVARMTLEEKTSQLCSEAPVIPRLGIPAYNWWNEGLHGVARAGVATVFPQAIGLAAMFDAELMHTVGEVTSIEGRIKHNHAKENGDRSIYKGLTFWSPNINIYRDPRWGRGHETYGEDPYLTSVCAENYIKGIQGGEDDRYMRAAACAKHFAAHSGPEGIRHGFNSEVTDFDLHDTYLPAFEWCIKKADVEGIMGAYNTINGVHCCANEEYMEGVMRQQWGFNGYYVSDCGALADMHMFCLITHTAVESAALALKSGCDLNCGQVYLHVLQAYKEGKVTEEEIDRAVIRVMATRFKLGMFDENCVYNRDTNYLKVESEEHLQKAYEAAVKSTVMLKNDGILPLDKASLKTIGVIGPNANSVRALEGNYNGTASRYSTILNGIQENADKEGIRVLYAQGSHLYRDHMEGCALPNDGISEAIAVAKNSDVVVMCMGIDSSIEGEQGDASNEYGAGDKLSLSFPSVQCDLLEAVKAVGKPIILVVLAGGALDLNWSSENCNAILYGWYPGVKGGIAISDIIFGKQNPSGKTPVTFIRSLEDIPAFEDYTMSGRTYRYMTKEPLYPFGYGLSYTTFEMSEVAKEGDADNLTASLTVKNTGDCDGEEVVQIYARYGKERYITPIKKLCGFVRVSLKKGEEKEVRIKIDADAIKLTDKDGSRYLPEISNLTFVTQ